MVKIAIAGGAGNVGQEVVDALVARDKHEIIILSRKNAPETEIAPGAKWFKTKYDNVEELTKMLEGVHTVLSFMSVAPGDTAAGPQEKLIDAAVRAGVKRFAPSEWASSNLDYFPWYDFKRSAHAAKVTALAVEYQEEWPIVSGVKGTDITMNELVALGEKIRGQKFKVEYLKSEDLKAGTVKASWLPLPEHPSIPVEMREKIAVDMIKCFLLGINHGALKVSDEWNKLLPEYEFTQPEEFLTKAWAAIDGGAKSVFTDN
ncbi:2`-hydroxyisoflavone reductase [Fusarium agapanthi]|uniref:2`-hydroxyisoflavone reductase n=1 Tax=Fusarium agapanthi TaxID=1803897 RepID=A0A9P5BF14_9HYPO|nr:2`-hydroxyisoflavone reductase [Fusarium agapanthi]